VYVVGVDVGGVVCYVVVYDDCVVEWMVVDYDVVVGGCGEGYGIVDELLVFG